ncbi:MAG TPA: sigma 54-interacting transcriptional regulator [Gemmatimonadaceae bacterium]|nr:sigma 54-interacting transcriptional regulator [Gemmatimonadaceae bacterium]
MALERTRNGGSELPSRPDHLARTPAAGSSAVIPPLSAALNGQDSPGSVALPAGDSSGSPESSVGLENIVGVSDALREALRHARKAAASRLTTVLIVGETGTGKELFARGIHYASPARGDPFMAVNCAAIPEALLESELFGHERGAFSDARGQKRGLLELAGTGTVFLDEIGELPRRLQPKLLRALENRRLQRLGGLEDVSIHCRVIAASNTGLSEAMQRDEFREDLYYRLNVFRIVLPPLRDREGDVELLARHFLGELARQQGMEAKTLSADAIAVLQAHAWPGNIRELKNVIEHAAILSEGDTIDAARLMLQKRMALSGTSAPGPIREIHIPPEGRSLADVEKDAVRFMLEITRGNRSAAARILGISRPTLARKIREYGIVVPAPGRDT